MSNTASGWRVNSATAARSEINAQEEFLSFFKVGTLQRVMSGRDTASLETGAGAKAANNSVDDLSEVIRSLDKKAQGEYSLRLLLAARSAEQLRDSVPAVHRVFVDARAQVMEETLGNLSTWRLLRRSRISGDDLGKYLVGTSRYLVPPIQSHRRRRQGRKARMQRCRTPPYTRA
jgi:hypothetical protein